MLIFHFFEFFDSNHFFQFSIRRVRFELLQMTLHSRPHFAVAKIKEKGVEVVPIHKTKTLLILKVGSADKGCSCLRGFSVKLMILLSSDFVAVFFLPMLAYV